MIDLGSLFSALLQSPAFGSMVGSLGAQSMGNSRKASARLGADRISSEGNLNRAARQNESVQDRAFKQVLAKDQREFAVDERWARYDEKSWPLTLSPHELRKIIERSALSDGIIVDFACPADAQNRPAQNYYVHQTRSIAERLSSESRPIRFQGGLWKREIDLSETAVSRIQQYFPDTAFLFLSMNMIGSDGKACILASYWPGDHAAAKVVNLTPTPVNVAQLVEGVEIKAESKEVAARTLGGLLQAAAGVFCDGHFMATSMATPQLPPLLAQGAISGLEGATQQMMEIILGYEGLFTAIEKTAPEQAGLMRLRFALSVREFGSQLDDRKEAIVERQVAAAVRSLTPRTAANALQDAGNPLNATRGWPETQEHGEARRLLAMLLGPGKLPPPLPPAPNSSFRLREANIRI